MKFRVSFAAMLLIEAQSEQSALEIAESMRLGLPKWPDFALARNESVKVTQQSLGTVREDRE